MLVEFLYFFNVYFLIIAIVTILGIFLLIELFLSIRFKRSIQSSFVETYLRFTSKRKKHARSRRKFNKYLKRHKNRSDTFIFPKVKLCSVVNEHQIDGIQVYHLSNRQSSNCNMIIIYLHGGAYISQPLKYHWKFCDKLSIDLNADIIFPIYPLTPNHHWNESFDLVNNLFNLVKEKTDKPIVLMGDSSGGGLALAFNEYLALNNLKQPNCLILLSPWLDITLSHPKISLYEKKDPMLACNPLKEIGLMWSNNLNPKDYRVSPLYGDVFNLSNVTMIVGTREILYPEVNQFYESLKQNNVQCDLYIGKGMNHDFPLFPIPEAKKAREYIYETIKKYM